MSDTMTAENTACIPMPEKSGWGGPRTNSGGPRPGFGGPQPGSGRPRKPKPPKEAYATAPTTVRSTPYGPKLLQNRIPIERPVLENDGTQVGIEAKRQPPGLTTGGSLNQFVVAWVYVAVRPTDGLVKIGMSGNVRRRCRQLHAVEFFSLPVMPGVARTLETMTLRKLGALKGGSEWVGCKPEDAAQAVMSCRDELSRFCHADPNETPTHAYRRRKGIAA